MKAIDIVDALSAVDDCMLNHALKSSKSRKFPYVPLVACLTAVVIVGGIFFTRDSGQNESPVQETAVMEASAANSADEEPQRIVISSSMPAITMEDLVERSALIVSGTITEKSLPLSIRSASGDQISVFTDWTLTVDTCYRGELPENEALKIRVQGGRNAKLIVENENAPDFCVGDTVLVFLYQPHMGGNFNTAEEDFYYLTGMLQGAFFINASEGTVWNPLIDSTETMEQLTGEIHDLSAMYTVDDLWLYHHNQTRMDEDLATGGIDQEAYDEFWERMSQYAIIIDEEVP